MYSVQSQYDSIVRDAALKRVLALRILIFIGIFLGVAGGGLIYDYSRPAVYRATSRLSVEPPGAVDEPTKAQFAVFEAQAMRRSDLMRLVAARLKELPSAGALDAGELERRFTVEHVAQTNVIELRGEGDNRSQLVAALGAWIDLYMHSRKDTDRQEGNEALEGARHAAQVARKAVDDKRRTMEEFRQRHGIISIERDENPSAARLKGLNNALNDAATREVNADARLKAVQDSLGQGKGVVRAADKSAIANLEMRAVDLRERIKDLESDYTQQYLALDPKYKALRANLTRVEQQVELEKDRSQKAALVEAQEELAGAQRAVQKIREQASALQQESQVFSTRFVELKRQASELEHLQEARRLALDHLAKLESARKPSEVRVRVLSAPSAGEDPIAPNYSRDAAISLAAGLVLAIAGVWLYDYLRREPQQVGVQASPPIIQIASHMIQPPAGLANASLPAGTPGLLAASPTAGGAYELTMSDISAIWRIAPAEGRLIVAAMFAGIAPSELIQLRWKHVDLDRGLINVPGASARALPLLDPVRHELQAKGGEHHAAHAFEGPLLADGDGNALDEAAVDGQLAWIAHDAGLRNPEEVTARALHFTYAAFLARQGIRMVDLAATIGRISSAVGSELMRLAPPGMVLPLDRIERVYPSFRAG